jgi:hypothetical protein
MKPLLIGLHNPHSSKPSHALLPWPAGCAGHKLLELMQYVEPTFTTDDYLEAFERTNLWGGQELPEGPGKRALLDRDGRRLFRYAVKEPRHVVLLGTAVWSCILNRVCAPDWFTSCVVRGSTFLNRIYNTHENRRRAGHVLMEVARGHVNAAA